jgi:Mitochondrial ribosomal protein L27
MTLIASILGGLGRSRRVPRTGLWQLNSKRGPRNFYKGKGVEPTGRHTRKGQCGCSLMTCGTASWC